MRANRSFNRRQLASSTPQRSIDVLPVNYSSDTCPRQVECSMPPLQQCHIQVPTLCTQIFQRNYVDRWRTNLVINVTNENVSAKLHAWEVSPALPHLAIQFPRSVYHYSTVQGTEQAEIITMQWVTHINTSFKPSIHNSTPSVGP